MCPKDNVETKQLLFEAIYEMSRDRRQGPVPKTLF
jgi:hypothetical protein